MINYTGAEPTKAVNYILLPVFQANLDEFNELYSYILENKFSRLKRTKSGGISISNLRLPAYDIKADKNLGAEIIYLGESFYRLQFRPTGTKNNHADLSGKKSYYRILKEFKKDNINLEDYYIDNGLEIKDTIESPIIKLCRDSYKDRTYEHVNHLDINSSYPAGLAESYPELRPTIERIYQNRKIDKSLKLAMDSAIGYMQSKYFKYRLAQFSKAAIEINNRKIREMLKYLEESGRVPIAINTDGIWYHGDPIDINQTELGGWKQDHVDCIFRAKSAGCYEFIEDDKYTPVVRGRTKLDTIKARSDWNWGDIYNNSEMIVYELIEGEGIRQNGKKN